MVRHTSPPVPILLTATHTRSCQPVQSLGSDRQRISDQDLITRNRQLYEGGPVFSAGRRLHTILSEGCIEAQVHCLVRGRLPMIEEALGAARIAGWRSSSRAGRVQDGLDGGREGVRGAGRLALGEPRVEVAAIKGGGDVHRLPLKSTTLITAGGQTRGGVERLCFAFSDSLRVGG